MRRRELPPEVRAALAELKDAFVRLYGERLRGLYLYGSYARGTFNEGSDLDVLVAIDGDVHPVEEIGRYNEVVSDICLRHDVLIATYPVPERWLGERKDPLFANVRREGIPL
ncbi:MAG: nucleotidyltransferase domain-containing protein [Chloroflexi bacterium]|nr:nucleotidyltransferase domain-containing protein [Chloroflexota bacterium]MBI4504559.1 nucleotidyltransferase domain-containing protein [Chloroflexota bacterium]